MSAGRAEQQPGETASSARPDHDKTGATRGLDERGFRTTAHRADLDFDVRELRDLVSDQFGRRIHHQLVHLFDAVFPLLSIERIVRTVVPSSDRNERNRAQRGSLEGASDRQVALGRVVEADHNRSAVVVFGLIRHDRYRTLRLGDDVIGGATKHLHQGGSSGAAGTHDDLVSVFARFGEQVGRMPLNHRGFHR